MSDIVERLKTMEVFVATSGNVSPLALEAAAEITRLRAALAAERVWEADPTAQTEPLTAGQRIVAWWETTTVSEPCELAQKIDQALAGMKERCAKVADIAASEHNVAAPFSIGYQQAAKEIAAAIRALDTEDGK